MKRYLSQSIGSSRRSSRVMVEPTIDEEDKESLDGTSVAETAVPLDPPSLTVMKYDFYYSKWTRSWKYKKMGANVIAEVVRGPPVKKGGDDAWAQYCFVVVRTLNNDENGCPIPTFKVTLKSQYLVDALKHVIQDVPGFSWHMEPLELDPKTLLSWLPLITGYAIELRAKGKTCTQEESYRLSCLEVFLQYLRSDYKATIASFEKLTAHGEISAELLLMLFVPRSILVTTCPITGEPQCLRLESVAERDLPMGTALVLECTGIDVVPGENGVNNSEDFGEVNVTRVVMPFYGATKITKLDAFPIQYHPDEARLRAQLIERGRKWVSLDGVKHMAYKGTAALRCDGKAIKYNLNSRVMIDRANFKKLVPNYPFPTKRVGTTISKSKKKRALPPPAVPNTLTPNVTYDYDGNPIYSNLANLPQVLQNQGTNVDVGKRELDEDELLLTPPNLYGFSLVDKLWLELNVEHVEQIDWNEEAFHSLVLPNKRKELLQSLVEAHNADLGFDDFVRGKGQGLVVNLFGPPGVGKTLSAEATSEHVKHPLYVIGGGDLGTNAGELDAKLNRIFDLATAWKAIVLIDEADVFLERRSMHDLERNAMVAIFLRHLEYYRGILFLTTNRVQAFDDAFLSRIHVALRFTELTFDAKVSVWTAFLEKNKRMGSPANVTEDEVRQLAKLDSNGREIKNAVRTANSLAYARKEQLSFKHLKEVMDVLDEFSVDLLQTPEN